MATYLPAQLGSVNAIPDDSVLSDLPRGQVDYLSHQWREEDVWRSWRSMTRLKNEIANGVRLENASWRTWWKQRNGLETISPETLNWLKDSDVTWLYGPLHTADPVPRPSPSTAAAALDLSSSPSPTFDGVTGAARKPILKHRSIGELLASDFPLSPMFSPPDSEEEGAPQIMSDGDPGWPHTLARPSLIHTKSDTHLTRLGPNRVFRRDSPPSRVVLPGSSLLQSESPPSSVPPGQKRKHISFNTFVEQCIAIDKPKKKRPHMAHFGNSCPLDDDGYDEDSEDDIIDEADEMLFDDDDDVRRPDSPSYPQMSHPLPPHHSPPASSVSPPSSSTSEEDDEEDVLEMRFRPNTSPPSAIPRSPTDSSSSSSSSCSRLTKARSATAGQRRRDNNGFIMRCPSTDKELVTIALIAPTILKTKLDDDDDEHSPYPLPHTHIPPYPRRARDPHHGKDWTPCGPHDSPVELVYVPPSYVYSATEESEDVIEQDRQTVAYEASLADQPRQPPPATQVPVAQQEYEADPAGSLQLLVDSARIPQPTEGTAMVERNPEVIVSSPDGTPDISRSRSRSGSRSRSRSRTPSPNAIIVSTNAAPSSSATAVSRTNALAQGTGNALLAPSDPSLLRGRSASSPSLPSQAQVEQSRGRSVTRTSSFSDRESLNTGSPLGSLSPDGSVGLGIGSVGVRDRERDARGEKEGKRSAERGRDRFTRRSGSHSGSGSHSSLSPDDPHAATRVIVVQPRLEQSPVPEVGKKCLSGSSSPGSSTVTVVPTPTARLPPRLVVDAKPITQTSYTEAPSASIPISPSYAQEEQESISRQPTPANSPVLPMRSPPFPSKSFPQVVRHERKHSSGSSRSPTRDGDDHGTLVGRAVEIMSNAGAFLGSFWHNGTPAGVPTSTS